MVKLLSEFCLDCLYKNFDKFSQTRLNLPSSICELLLRRLVNHDRLTANYLPAITYNLISPRLERLDFYGSKQLDNNFLTHVAMVCTNLRCVRLVRCLNVADIGIAELLANQTNLENLELRWLVVEGYCFSRLASLNNLKRLVLKGCSYVNAEHLSNFVCRNRKLETLNFRGLRKINDKAMIEIATALNTNLRHLDISECLSITDSTLLALAENCSNLKRLSLMECMNVSENGLTKVLTLCPNLEKLDLSFCSRWEKPMKVAVVESLPKGLTSLSLTGIQIDCNEERFCSVLDQLPHLSALYLNGFGLLSDQFLESLLQKIGAKLTDFDLSGSYGKISDRGLNWVGEYCTNLRYFGAALLTDVTCHRLKPMFSDRSRAERLKTLIFTMCTTIEYDVLMLMAENCNNLVKLDVSGVVNVDDVILSTLADTCPNLQCLFAKARIQITDESVCHLATKCAQLKCLCLSGNQLVSDRSILALANHCHYLQELYLSGCSLVSEMAIRYLQDQLIDRVSVYHVVTNACDERIVVAKNLDTGKYVRMGRP